MGVNDMEFNQASTLLVSLVKQATGQAVLTPTDTSEFVSVAQTALKCGYDPLGTAISQVLSRTIFSIRPYNGKFNILRTSPQKWGAITRKLNPIDSPWVNDDRFNITDAQNNPQQLARKNNVLQTVFYGANVYQRYYTIYKDQLDNAFSGPDEFAQYITMIVQNNSDQIQQAHEETSRATISNFIAGKVLAAGNGVIHLLTEYNAALGLTGDAALTATTVLQPDNYLAFIEWMYARIKTASDFLTERSLEFHQNVTDKPVMRHTPYDRQRIFLYQPFYNQISKMVMPNVYNDRYLNQPYYEGVNYWQSISSPTAVNITPAIMAADGTVSAAENPVAVNNVIGLICDEEALGYTPINEWSQPAPFNARFGFQTIYNHFTDKYWNDFTENGIVLLLD